ncbi:hypothetical protein GCM10020255_014430 [Rhodococcus baikonurensis]
MRSRLTEGAIAGQVGASAGEDVQIHSDVVSGADGLEVAPHAGLVGDDYRVLGVFSELKMILQFEGWNLVRRVQ